MKKSDYTRLAIEGRKFGSSKDGDGRSINGMDKPAGSKLARKAAENRVGARTVGVVSLALANIAKSKRAA